MGAGLAVIFDVVLNHGILIFDGRRPRGDLRCGAQSRRIQAQQVRAQTAPQTDMQGLMLQ